MRPVLACLVLTAATFAAGCDRREPPISCFGPEELTKAAARPEWTADMQAIADGSNAFAFDLYRKLTEKPGNVFVSPFSAHAALSMTADGAKGVTRDEMVRVLHLPADPEKALAAGDVGRFYAAGGEGYELVAANALWGQKGFPWRPDFLDRQSRRFGAGFNEADFRANPEAERVRINKWVEGQTRDRIKELLKPDIITSNTTMVLTNAIYFKGEWAEQFDPKLTREAPFTLADGTKKTVPMMHRTGGFRMYVEPSEKGFWEPKFQVAEIPYRGSDLSMVVILPGKHNGLPELERTVTPTSLAMWLTQTHDAAGSGLSLPKFRLEPDSELLNDPLKQMGMPTAFTPGHADFTGMATEPPGWIHAVVHKAFVDVNEQGTEAAAATAVVIGRGARQEFRADRPFLFLIRDVKRDTILFMGRYETP